VLTWTNERHVAQVTVWDLVDDDRIVARAGYHPHGRACCGAQVGLHWFWRLDRRAVFWTHGRRAAERAVERAARNPDLPEAERHHALWLGLHWAYDVALELDERDRELPRRFPGTRAEARLRLADQGELREPMVPVVIVAAGAKWREICRFPRDLRPRPSYRG
jgi:hypothetical protein